MQHAGPWLLLIRHCTALSGEGKESRPTGTKATQTAAEPEEQPMPVGVAPILKKKFKNKSISIVRDEKETGPSKPEKETQPDIIT